MESSEILVVVGGIAAIVWVNWYFFLAERRSAAAEAKAGATGLQQAVIRVGGATRPRACACEPASRRASCSTGARTRAAPRRS